MSCCCYFSLSFLLSLFCQQIERASCLHFHGFYLSLALLLFLFIYIFHSHLFACLNVTSTFASSLLLTFFIDPAKLLFAQKATQSRERAREREKHLVRYKVFSTYYGLVFPWNVLELWSDSILNYFFLTNRFFHFPSFFAPHLTSSTTSSLCLWFLLIFYSSFFPFTFQLVQLCRNLSLSGPKFTVNKSEFNLTFFTSSSQVN